MKSAPPCGSVRKSWECCISVTGSFQNDPRRIAFLSRGGCQSSLTAADREQLEGLRDQKPGHFVNSPLLADFQLSLEHAASLLEENTDIHRQSAERPAGLGGDLQPPDPNPGLTAVGSSAAMPREKLFQRAWPRMMIGVMFVLEVIWIVLLVGLSIAFVRFAFLRP
jgi:hypothetical protein